MKKITLILSFLLFFPLLTRAEVIEEFLTDITLNLDSSLQITEKILYDFEGEERHGIYRDIPLVYALDDGSNLCLPINIQGVKDEQGKKYNYTLEADNYLRIKIGDENKTITGKHWYYIDYQIEGAIDSYAKTDELYLNITGNDWEVPIKYAGAEVSLPEGAQETELSAECYTGFTGSTEKNCQAEITGNNRAIFYTTQELTYYQGMTIILDLPKNIVTPPGTLTLTTQPEDVKKIVDGKDYTDYLNNPTRISAGEHELEIYKFKYHTSSSPLVITPEKHTNITVNLAKVAWAPLIDIFLPLVIFLIFSAALYLIWSKNGRDPKGRGTIIPIYEPPLKLTPGELGVVVDQCADMRDLSASIIQLAVNGYLKIRKTEKKKLLGNSLDFEFIKVKPEDDLLLDYEKQLYQAIFKNTKTTKLETLKNNFYLSLPKIKTALYASVTEKQFFAGNPEKTRILYFGIGAMLVVLGLGAILILGILLESFWYYIILAPLFIEIILFCKYMPKRTALGVKTYEEILGFKMYLQHAEKYRIERLYAPKNYQELFEKFLPYAIALKVENAWATQFKDLAVTPPSWYEGSGYHNFNTLLFIGALNSFNSSAISSLNYNPSAHGGGGGGGFSGGGFGGGGGGSW